MHSSFHYLFFWLDIAGGKVPHHKEFLRDNLTSRDASVPNLTNPATTDLWRGGGGFQYLESLRKIIEVSLPIAPVPSRPHFSVAQEVLNGKSVTQTPCRDSFLPSLYKWVEVIHILNAFLPGPLYNCNPVKCQAGWSQSPIKELTLSSALKIYDRLQKSMAALEGCSCKILPKGLKMEQRWWTCNYRIEILSSPKVAFHSYYCKWERAFTFTIHVSILLNGFYLFLFWNETEFLALKMKQHMISGGVKSRLLFLLQSGDKRVP